MYVYKRPQQPQVLVFEHNTGKSCGGIMARENSKIFIDRKTSVYFISNSGFNGGALALYGHSVLHVSYFKYSRLVPKSIRKLLHPKVFFCR